MDQCASALLAFPKDNVRDADNEHYHKLALLHVQRLAKLVTERSKDLTVYSSDLFNVGL
jgi:hypothetical protein